MTKPVVLVILDGWGLGPEASPSNALDIAHLPVYRGLIQKWPSCSLRTDGESVGLMPGQAGDSNVGHLTMGAGRVVFQDYVRVTRSIENGTFFENSVLSTAMEHSKARGTALHIMGLLSPGGVHSHQEHCFALIKMARQHGLKQVYVHCFLDGRDTPPKSALESIRALEAVFKEQGVGAVGTVMGRYYAMDRDARWDRTQRAYNAMVIGRGLHAPTAEAAVSMAYNRGETDEFVLPTVIAESPGLSRPIRRDDSVIMYNYRADRARQITHAFVDERVPQLRRPLGRFPVFFAAMTRYDEALSIPTAFAPQFIKNTFGEVVSKAGLTQLRVAETEKYAHVTYFFNGMEETPFKGEHRILIPSPKVPTYDLVPEMSAPKVLEEAIRGVHSGYDSIIVNFANADMVGHTGNIEAAVRAVETVDKLVGELMQVVLDSGGTALLVSDHGNVEKMRKNGEPFTAHTKNRVPCILVDPRTPNAMMREDGCLSDVAPTLLNLLGVGKPEEMTGRDLVLTDIAHRGMALEHDSRSESQRSAGFERKPND